MPGFYFTDVQQIENVFDDNHRSIIIRKMLIILELKVHLKYNDYDIKRLMLHTVTHQCSTYTKCHRLETSDAF